MDDLRLKRSATPTIADDSEDLQGAAANLRDEWLNEYPDAASWLEKAELGLVAETVTMRMWSLEWQARSPKLAAILYLLYVQELLASDRETVFNLSRQNLFAMLGEEVRARGLSRAGLQAEIEAFGARGRLHETVHMCETMPLPPSFFKTSEKHKVRAAKAVGSVLRKPRPGSSLRALWIARPAANLAIRWHFWVVVVCGTVHSTWPSAQELFVGPASWQSRNWRTSAVNLGSVLAITSLAVRDAALPCPRSVRSASLVPHASPWPWSCMPYSCGHVDAWVCAPQIVFPTGLESTGGARFAWPCAAVHCLGQMFTITIGLLSYPHPNRPCQAVYSLLTVGLLVKNVQCLHRCAHNRFSWSMLRLLYVMDGAFFLVADLALVGLGSPRSGGYPPGNCTLDASICRAIVMALIGIVFTEPNRQRIRAVSSAVIGEPCVTSMVHLLGNGHSYPIAESAQMERGLSRADVAGVAASMMWNGDEIEGLVRRQLNRRYVRHSVALCLIISTWFLLVEYLSIFRAREGLFGLVSEPRRLIIFAATFACVALSPVFLITAFFPTQLHSSAGRIFVLPVAIGLAAFTIYFAARSYLHDGVAVQVNDACRCIHLVLCVCSSLVWTSLTVLCAAGRGTWSVVRAVLLLDGLTFILAALAMRHFGPPPYYLPHNVSLPEAVARATITPLIAAGLTSAVRDRVAALANHNGLNHVCISLMQLGGRRASSKVP